MRLRFNQLVGRHYSPLNPLKASIVDGLTAMVAMAMFSLGYAQLVNFLGRHDPLEMVRLLGYYEVSPRVIDVHSLVILCFYGAFTIAFSRLAIKMGMNYTARDRRSISHTITAILIALIGGSLIWCVFIDGDFPPEYLGGMFENAMTVGLIMIPAAIRLTGKRPPAGPKGVNYNYSHLL